MQQARSLMVGMLEGREVYGYLEEKMQVFLRLARQAESLKDINLMANHGILRFATLCVKVYLSGSFDDTPKTSP